MVNLAPEIVNLEVTPTKVSFRILLEPEPQVRMTGTSASYLPGPVRYNGYKHAVANAIKAALRKISAENLPLQGGLSTTFRFGVSVKRRFWVVDKSNYTKSIEDAINACREGKHKDYPDTTDPFPIWEDDRFVVRGVDEKVPSRIGYTDVEIEILYAREDLPEC